MTMTTMTTTSPAVARTHLVITSPIGPLTLVQAGGALCGLYMDAAAHPPASALLGAPAGGDGADGAVLAEAAGQLGRYFAGELTGFDLPLRLDGTGFQLRVWAALQGIGYGETISYRQLAERIGQPSAVRAVGLANGRNPVSIIVPCHRVIGADGSLTGYGGGLDRKLFLLDLERRVLPGAGPGPARRRSSASGLPG
jgi:methylated-DNA-[protein]-cysteine S-methyltransferase